MNKLIVIVGLAFSLSVLAQEQELEPKWKTKARTIITSIVGESWGEKLLGPVPVLPAPEMKLPKIPIQFKKSTDVGSYIKLKKTSTEYDRLPSERKRQFDYKFLQELFLATRRTEAKDEDLSSWLNTLDQGGSREGVYQALVLDEVYAALENMEEIPKERLLDLSLKFSQRFLNQTFKKESLKKLNLYSIKRILSEKSLDLMEYYEVNNLEDLYHWYAIFSSEIAKDYAPILKTQIRQDQRVNFHLEWARNMPIQHIKSEFIIKLHIVMNALQFLE